MPTLRIHLLGHLSIHSDSHSVEHLAATRARELLCYLLLHQLVHHPREQLAEALWDGLPTAQARKHLRQALWQLQSTFETICGDATARILIVESESVHIALDEEVWLDVDAFAQAHELVRGIDGSALVPAQVDELRRAVALYHGDLLEGWYHPWCLIDRERYHAMHLVMLDKLMAACEAVRAYEEAVDYGLRSLHFDRAREATHLRLMRLYYLIGDRTAALRQFDRCVRALREELDVCPAERTDVLYHQIRADRMDDVVTHPVSCPAMATAPLCDILHQLDHLQATLDAIRRSVQQLQLVDRPIQPRPTANGHSRG